MKCSGCGTESTPGQEKHWRRVTVKVEAVPPRVAGTKKIEDILCPLCAGEADNAIERRQTNATAH